MSMTKRWLEDLSVITGGDGEITDQLLDFADRLTKLAVKNKRLIKLDENSKTIQFAGGQE